jgi:ribosome-binding factor A
VSHRHEQLESTLKRALQQVLSKGLNDPRAEGAMITVTGLELSPDLKNAIVLLTIYPPERQKLVMHAIRHAAAHLRHQAAELVSMKQLPVLYFESDTSLKKQAEVLDAFRKVSQERERAAPPAPDIESEPVPGKIDPEAGRP